MYQQESAKRNDCYQLSACIVRDRQSQLHQEQDLNMVSDYKEPKQTDQTDPPSYQIQFLCTLFQLTCVNFSEVYK